MHSAGLSIILVMGISGWEPERPLKRETPRGRENHLTSSKFSAGKFF